MNQSSKENKQGTKHKSEDERRVQILEAAMICFASNGYHKTTMKHLVETSHLSKGAIYHYFKSKELILIGLIEYWDQELSIELNMLSAQHDYLDSLKQFCLSKLDFFMEYKRLSYAFYELKDNTYVSSVIGKSMNVANEQVKTLLINTGYDESKKNLSIDLASVSLITMFEGLFARLLLDESLDRFIEFERIWPAIEQLLADK